MGILRFAKFLERHTVTNDTRGAFGEMVVNSIFDPRVFGDEEHYIINNLILENNQSTHQIDHVVIYKTGIFCIETKNIQGIISGTDTDRYWCRLHRNKTWSFYNPILQNYKHKVVLSSFLNNEYLINSLIVFIKGNKPKGVNEEVINIQELKDYVKNYPCKKELSSEEMRKIYDFLFEYKQNCNISSSEHRKNINNKK